MAWIKLQIRANDPRILFLAEQTGAAPEKVFTAVVGRWWWWCDDHAEDASIRITRAGFRAETRWPNDKLAEAMKHPKVDWLVEDQDGLGPTRWESHMSKGAKVRAINAKNAAASRNRHTNGVTKPPPREEKSKRREDQDTKPVSESRGREDADGAVKHEPTIVERVAARIGCDLGSEGSNLTRGQDRYAARSDVLIHGQPVPALDLFDRCVVAALAEPGFSYRHAQGFLNYVGVIFNRCERDQVWPEERAGPANGKVNRATEVSNAQAERLKARIAARTTT